MLGRQYVSKVVCRCWHCRVYSLTVEDGSWSTPMVPTLLSVPLQKVEEYAPKPVGWRMCFLLTTSSLAWTLMIVCTSVYIYIYIYIYIYNCAFESLISDVTCNYVSADGGRDGLWWPALLGHWLSYTGCWQSLLVIYWLMFGMLFQFLTTSRGWFCLWTMLFEKRTELVAMDLICTCFTKDNQQGCFRLSTWFSLPGLGSWMNHFPPAW